MTFSNNEAISNYGLEACDRDVDAVVKLVPQVDRDCLQDIQFLDKGNFGQVRLVTLVGGPPSLRQMDSSRNNQTVLDGRRKLFASKSVNLNSDDLQNAAEQLANEVKILSGLDHKNIIKLRGVCSERFSETFVRGSLGYFLLLDVLDETLETRLKEWRRKKSNPPRLFKFKGSKIHRKVLKRLSPTSAVAIADMDYNQHECQIMYDRIQDTAIGIARGLEYLHARQIVWRDLKPSNVGYCDCNIVESTFTDKRTKTGSTVRLIDFGMAEEVQNCQPELLCGSLRYMAPEIMQGQRYTPEADVFSFGVLLSEVCSLRRPYEKTKNKKNMSLDEFCDIFSTRLARGKIRPIEDLETTLPCSKIRALIQECWDAPVNRPTFTEIVSRLDDIFHLSKLSDSENCTEVYTD